MKALIVTSEYYGAANRIGSHHLARQFAKRGIEVFVISFPISPLYFMAQQKTQYDKRNVFSRGFVESEKNIWVYVPKVITPPLPALVKFIPWLLDHWYKFARPGFRKVISEHLGSEVEFILTDSVFFPFIQRLVHCDSFVVRIPDLIAGFWANNKTLLQSESRLLEKADLVVTSSRQLQQKMNQAQGIDAMFLPNGVETQRFKAKTTIPDEYRKAGRHRAIYVGALKNWFDFELLTRLARAKENWDFFIIGDHYEIGSLPESNNIHLLGEKSQAECVPFIQHANVGIIPFKKDTQGLVDHVNPIKLYEYLAAGIPVVATRWRELELIKAPIFFADSLSDFESMLEQSLQGTNEDRLKRQKFAAQFSWDKIAGSLLEMIKTR